jgi:hypothetical protein
MGGSVQVETHFSHANIDENASDQSKHKQDPKIGTENTKGPESECKDGGDTSKSKNNKKKRKRKKREKEKRRKEEKKKK